MSTTTTTVRYRNTTNSTLFSMCCACAVCDDEAACPRCGAMVLPRDSRVRHADALRAQMGPKAYDAHCARVARLVQKDREIRLARQGASQ